MKSILIIDDEKNIRTILYDIFIDENYSPFVANDWSDAKKILLSSKIDVILLDICLPKISGLEILEILKREYSNIEVIIISGQGNIDLAVKAIKKGAFDFIEKPLSLEKVITIVENAIKIKELKEENENLKNQVNNQFYDVNIIGKSKHISDIKDKINIAAKSDARVFITGENGTGKEVVAKSIHLSSNRKTKSFIDINCAAIPENLIESELFGYEKGAFTGAINSKKGKFELADKGTLFLDEIADMSLGTQTKVLRVLQEMKFEKVGGVNSINIDVRIISATNKNILKEIDNGNFREDLYYRLNVIPIHLIPLRERKEDIPLLVNHYNHKISNKLHINKKIISTDAMDFLSSLPWNGNIRELKNVIERLSVMVEKGKIDIKDIHKYVNDQIDENYSDLLSKEENLKIAKDDFEKKFIQKKLMENDMNISKTAKILEIERSHLYKKIKKYNLL